MLNVTGIQVFYDNIHAIKDVSFNVDEGEIVTLIGANGAGKSTILKTISGLIRPAAGKIEFLGHSIVNLSPHKIVRKRLAHCPEGRRLFLQMNVRENLQMGAYSREDVDMEAELAAVYERFPILDERRNQRAGSLSGGEQQMLAMGRAMMAKPLLLMLDEPSMGLAPILVEQIFDLIVELNDAGTTILLVEQNAEMALSIADRGYVLETGSVVTTGNCADLLNDERLKKAYLGG